MLDITNTPDETKVVTGNPAPAPIPVSPTKPVPPPPSATPPPTAPKPVPPDDSLAVDEFSTQKKLSLSGVLTIIATVIFLLGSIMLYFQSVSLNATIKAKDAQDKDVTSQLQATEIASLNQELSGLNQKLKIIDDYHAQAILYEKIISDIAGRVVKDAKITNLVIDQKGNIKVDFELKTIQDIRKQQLAFSEYQNFKNVKMDAVSIGSGENAKNTMTISLNVSPANYKSTNQAVNATGEQQ